MVNALDCDNVISEFEFQSNNYAYFRVNILGNGKKSLCYILTLDRAVNQEMHLCK